jgi:chemotaxis protein methyltransferase CheR
VSTSDSIAPAANARAMSRHEFGLFQQLIREETGIYLGEGKRELLMNRLAPRLRDLRLATFEEYYLRIEAGDEEERIRMLDRVSTNETRFFREPRHFEFIEDVVLPEWRALAEARSKPKRIRAWSCACATGEEPYSLAMSLLTHVPPADGWDLQILGTDISTRALEKAGRAVWSIEQSNHIPPTYLKTFMLRGTRSQHGKMAADDAVRAIVKLKRFNLSTERYPFDAELDLIFCRNVLIYFDAEARRHVLEQLSRCLAPNGLLFLGHAETAVGMTSHLRAVRPTIYTRVP